MMKRLIDLLCAVTCIVGIFAFYRMIIAVGQYFDTHPVRYVHDLFVLVVFVFVSAMLGMAPLIILSLRGDDEFKA